MPQATVEQISNSRLTLVAGQSFFEHLNDWNRPLPDHPWLAGDYGAIVGRLRGGVAQDRYAFPWRPSQKSRFWREYCEGTPLSQVSTRDAIRLLVPLRLVPAPSPVITVDLGQQRLFHDVYLYPFGVAIALTIPLVARPSLPLDDWRDRIRALRMTPCYTVELPGSAAQQGLAAADALTAVLDWYRNAYFGTVSTISGSYEPFSIVSVIQGDGIDPHDTLENRPDLQRLLNAITAWPVHWQATRPSALEDARLTTRNANVGAGDALYAAQRGRTIWRPALFTYRAPAGARLHTLSCLTHNLIAGSVQAESLRLFAVRYGTLDGTQRSAMPSRLRHNVATQIERLYWGEHTYRSSSIGHLLGDPASLAQVNALLQEFGCRTLPSAHAAPAPWTATAS